MVDPEDARDAAERIVVLIEAAEAGMTAWDLVLVADELHRLLVSFDALPPDLEVQMLRLGLA